MNGERVSGFKSLLKNAACTMALFVGGVASALAAAPVISGAPPANVQVGQQYYYHPNASDADGDRLRFSIKNRPSWASFDSRSGTLKGNANKAGVWSNIVIYVSDGRTSVSTAPFAITASEGTPSNAQPVISGAPTTSVTVNQAYNFRPSASDADGDSLTFAIANRPSWANFNTTTGALTGTPTTAGTFSNIAISVSDGRGGAASLASFTITVNAAPNRAPTISGAPSTSVIVNQAYSFRPTASDADGDSLTFAITNRPSWANFNTTTGTLSGTPTATGTFSNIAISVSDGKTSAALGAFAITVNAAPNRAPTISGAPATSVTANQAYSFRPTASDADGDPLTFSIANGPSWASFSAATGTLSGTPTAAGTFSNIVISVSDGKTSAALGAFTITVNAAPNRAPTISGSPSTSVTANQAYSFRPTASDADGDTLGFSIQNRPSWATFSTANGTLSGTPTAAGTHSSIVITVSDGKTSTALSAFTITVNAAPNRAPTISGAPGSSVNAGSAYTFRPTAADADGDTLTFAVANRPSWATFNTSTGQLSGTPAAADAGVYSNIAISVNDGRGGNVSLAPFAITVNQPTTGSATLSWTAPTQNTDGSSLTNLAGFRIYYGTSSAALTQTVEVANPSISTYVIDGLTPTTYYFAVRAYTSVGAESANSNVASKTVQ